MCECLENFGRDMKVISLLLQAEKDIQAFKNTAEHFQRKFDKTQEKLAQVEMFKNQAVKDSFFWRDSALEKMEIIAKLEDKILSEEMKLCQMTKEAEGYKKELFESKSESTLKINKLTCENAEQEEEIRTLKDTTIKIMGEMFNINDELSIVKAENEVLKEENSYFSKQVSESQDELRIQKNRCGHLEKEINTILGDREELISKNLELEKRLNKFEIRKILAENS